MPSLWFVVPARGRIELARICLEQLRRTCDALSAEGIDASAVVIADDENLDTARDLEFAWLRRGNRPLSRKFNDGIELALTNPRPADYVVPCGSDDWVDWRLLVDLPPVHVMVGFQKMTFVSEDGGEGVVRWINYEGGTGIRIYSREIMSHLGFRPADEDRAAACDTSILFNLRRACRFEIEHRDLDGRQLVDWKSTGNNLNSSQSVARYKRLGTIDPFTDLEDFFPRESLEAMRDHYCVRELVA